MEKRITVHNPTAMPLYVGSDMVPPGETRDFPESRVPPHLRPAEEVPEEVTTQHDPLAELLAGSVSDVVEKFSTLSDADLASLIEQEDAGKKRKTLLDALNRELADRTLTAAAVAQLEGDEAAVLAAIEHAEEAELERMAEIEAAGANREAVLSAIAAEQLKRKG